MARRTLVDRPVGRRGVLAWLGAGAALPLAAGCGADPAAARTYPVSYTDAQWKKRLTGQQYSILRKAATERPGSSPLLKEHRKGTFHCIADNQPLFSSATKFESNTGWPSFWKPLPGAVETSSDNLLGFSRTEVHCARCGGHLGHVFDDGPKPTGLRYCMNGAVLKFVPA